jgi:hypothetical protein
LKATKKERAMFKYNIGRVVLVTGEIIERREEKDKIKYKIEFKGCDCMYDKLVIEEDRVTALPESDPKEDANE